MERVPCPVDISIHAPLAGCDRAADHGGNPPGAFQSTHPLRGATRVYRRGQHHRAISIHAPLAGCDTGVGQLVSPYRPISIHAPLAGCDCGTATTDRSSIDFNPRTPCGVRPSRYRSAPGFLPISIHAPLAGCDQGWRCICCFHRISIHAPLAGCDSCWP